MLAPGVSSSTALFLHSPSPSPRQVCNDIPSRKDCAAWQFPCPDSCACASLPTAPALAGDTDDDRASHGDKTTKLISRGRNTLPSHAGASGDSTQLNPQPRTRESNLSPSALDSLPKAHLGTNLPPTLTFTFTLTFTLTLFPFPHASHHPAVSLLPWTDRAFLRLAAQPTPTPTPIPTSRSQLKDLRSFIAFPIRIDTAPTTA